MLVRQLEEQLRITHEQLQATTEQLETSNEGFLSANEELMSINEEFQSANEELQSTNEELETSKEELQALNEELVTVNAELQGKVEELNQANSDMENLLASSEIATIFLDRQLNIKRFSPAMAAIFNLIPADIGRPFRHLAGTIDWSGPSPATRKTVLAEALPVEREVTTLEGGRCYLMRVLPYRSSGGKDRRHRRHPHRHHRAQADGGADRPSRIFPATQPEPGPGGGFRRQGHLRQSGHRKDPGVPRAWTPKRPRRCSFPPIWTASCGTGTGRAKRPCIAR